MLNEKNKTRLAKACDVSGLPEDILLNIAVAKGLDVLEREGVKLQIINAPPVAAMQAPQITLPVGVQEEPSVRRITI